MGIGDDPAVRNDQPRGRDIPGSVDELGERQAWNVTYGSTARQWITAEWHGESCGERWMIGLTPVRQDTVAAMLWSGDRLVDHARGTESAMCAMAWSWINELQRRSEAQAAEAS